MVDFPTFWVWAWFKPAQAPHTAILRLPDETLRSFPDRRYLTMRRLLVSAGIDPRTVALWNYGGAGCDAAAGTSPLLDQPLPDLPPGADPNITVVCLQPGYPVPAQPAAAQPAGALSAAHQPTAQQPGAAPSAPAAATPTFASGGAFNDVFENIEVNWATIVQIEKTMVGLRKQLSSMVGRLNTLNRDLGPDERLHADRQDRSDWQTARRWLRDVEKRVSQCIKTYDIGERSYAGQRAWYEQMYEQKVVPRQPFEGMEQMQRDFETHRKTVQHLMMSMNQALQTATQDGERRAQQILTKIANSVRAAKSKR